MKSKTNEFKIIFVFLIMSSIMMFGQNKVVKDVYGRDIINLQGEKIYYSQKDTLISSNDQKSYKSQLKLAKVKNDFSDRPVIQAKLHNLYSIMGTSIGRNSMHSVDVDNDGIVELICAASSETFGANNFWYIMNCIAKDKSCNQIWVSPQYENSITNLEVVDLKKNKNYSIILTFTDGSIQIFDGKTRELVKLVKPVDERINSIVYGDADNDSVNDFVIACENSTYILDATTFAIKAKISQGSKYVKVGNVDADPNNEVVLSYGAVYRITGSTSTNLWRFNRNGDGLLQLSDIDGDSMQEIVFAESWYKINIYDADTKTTKYTITTNLDIDTLYLKDVNNDGVDEILYGDAQWGSIICYNAVTRAKMWSVENPDSGVAAINYADLNNDGKQELIWTSGWRSTGPDYLNIYDVAGKKLIWKSADVVGPFYAIEKGDVDGDGKDEIVAVSYEGESGYESGVLVIIDAQTNKVKWKSEVGFLKQIWTGLHNVSIKDIDNDGQNEIIIAAGEYYTGAIWIIDGKNYSIKSSYVFSTDDIDELYALTVDDIDNDAEQELIVASNKNLYSIRPSDWAIEWKVSISNYSYEKPILRCSDLNGDGKKETILCKGEIQIVNGSDQSFWTSQENNYVNFDLFDFNDDGVLDIVATTTNGYIVTIDGKSKEIINEINPEISEIYSVRLKKIENDILYIYSCDGRIHFYKNEFSRMVSPQLGLNVGELESLKVFDSLNNDIEVLIGTKTSVLRMNPEIESFLLSTNLEPSNVSIKNDFQIYPVPAKDVISLKLPGQDILNCFYDILDINGRIIKSNIPIKNQQEEVDLTGLNSGFYFMRLKTNSSNSIKKFIIE